MAVGAIPSWQDEPSVVPIDAVRDRDRLPWPLACLIIGGASAALWSLIWAVIVWLVT